MPVRSSFTAGEVLTAADLTDTFASKADTLDLGRGISTNITLALSDAFTVLTITGSTGYNVTVPPDSSVNFPVGSVVEIWQQAGAPATLVAGSGVTLYASTLVTPGTHLGLRLVKLATNAWWITPFSGGVGNADFSNAATGTYTSGGISYKYVTFTASGTLTVTKAGLLSVFMVGGGGGGSVAGGGGGGFVQFDNIYVATNVTITVGGGGAASTVGNSSLFGSLRAFGGGAPIYQAAGNNSSPQQGGSGSGTYVLTGSIGRGSQGNDGGASATGSGGASGGGGAGAAGVANAGTSGGAGGAGAANAISGTSVTYAGGGGGWGSLGFGAGGAGGGGAASGTGVAGTANTGGGGGGGSANPFGAAGGSGIVIVRVRTN